MFDDHVPVLEDSPVTIGSERFSRVVLAVALVLVPVMWLCIIGVAGLWRPPTSNSTLKARRIIEQGREAWGAPARVTVSACDRNVSVVTSSPDASTIRKDESVAERTVQFNEMISTERIEELKRSMEGHLTARVEPRSNQAHLDALRDHLTGDVMQLREVEYPAPSLEFTTTRRSLQSLSEEVEIEFANCHVHSK
ncbi:hypothetical protein AK812_SmicGene10624 [Symbiodinium microadriaticum]|uniref:Uncharacterized protein n=1 Tax=Symbiodinium microadriaticum TaxID=2951 RepID=A0A1Q9EFE6_SYMMI|nr:hypothetical protein AK812_SmicGene10624 [Symbiodinium microadriaticum]